MTYEHVHVEECNAGCCGALRVDAQQDSDEHHGYAQTGRADHHRLTSSESVQEQCWYDRADDEADIDSSANDLRKVWVDADVVFESRWHKVSDFFSGRSS